MTHLGKRESRTHDSGAEDEALFMTPHLHVSASGTEDGVCIADTEGMG